MTMMFEIRRNAPPLANRQGSPCCPFDDMNVGDAFDAPRDQGLTPYGKDRRQRNVATSAAAWARRHNPAARFAVRIIDEHTVRCRREA